MWSLGLADLELADAWLEEDPSARWRSTSGHGPSSGGSSSGSSVLEVDPGCYLPTHTDSAEETVVVVAGRAEVTVGGERSEVEAPGAALVPKDVPHSVRNVGSETLRFLAVYAAPEVVTRYDREVQPDGERERSPVE